MAINGTTKSTGGVRESKMNSNSALQHVQQLKTPPGKPGAVYRLPFLGGENIYIPCSSSATRLLVTGKETNNAFAIVGSGGTASAPIGFHFHREAHDVFVCIKGQVNVWAGDQCRTLSPGDFTSVPPTVVHQYQILGQHTEFLGLIVPGGWEEFFRFIGEPYAGPLFPLSDDRNPFEVLIPKLKLAAQEFDVVPQPHLPHFNPQPWQVDADNVLPDSCGPAYFLRNGTGPKFLLAGSTLVTPLIRGTQSNHRFEIGTIEGSSSYPSAIFASSDNCITFNTHHHAVQVCDGHIDFTVAGESARLGVGETLFIPAGTPFRFTFASALAKAYFFAGGTGLVELLCRVGKAYSAPLIPGKVEDGEADASRSGLRGLEAELGYTLA